MSRGISSALPRWATEFTNFAADFVKFCRGKLWALIMCNLRLCWLVTLMFVPQDSDCRSWSIEKYSLLYVVCTLCSCSCSQSPSAGVCCPAADDQWCLPAGQPQRSTVACATDRAAAPATGRCPGVADPTPERSILSGQWFFAVDRVAVVHPNDVDRFEAAERTVSTLLLLYALIVVLFHGKCFGRGLLVSNPPEINPFMLK